MAGTAAPATAAGHPISAVNMWSVTSPTQHPLWRKMPLQPPCNKCAPPSLLHLPPFSCSTVPRDLFVLDLDLMCVLPMCTLCSTAMDFFCQKRRLLRYFSVQGARTVVIAEPVYPADSPARSAMSASAVASPALGTAAALKFQPTRAASSGAFHCQICTYSGAAGGLHSFAHGVLSFPL